MQSCPNCENIMWEALQEIAIKVLHSQEREIKIENQANKIQ
jgi:hypothetical protein